MPIIEARDAGKTFDRVTALEQVSFTVESGEIIGLLGPNGSGKTTLLRLLCAYFPPTVGAISVAGYDTRTDSLAVRRRIGYALEGVVLYPDLTVRDFLAFVREVKQASARQVEMVIDQCEVAQWLHRRIGTLSKGYRQRVVLAQALLGDPPILLLDEPTASMDPEMAVRIRGRIKASAGAQTVLLSTHALSEARLLCDRVFVLYQGKLLAQGTPHALFPEQEASLTSEEIFLRLLKSATRGRPPEVDANT
jgi:ABC-2 type transport system ATP-binding protein